MDIETTDRPAFLKHYTRLDRLLAILESGSLRLAGCEKAKAAINAALSKDLGGNPRRNGVSAIDMGAYEY
jgi:hypothetical protein